MTTRSHGIRRRSGAVLLCTVTTTILGFGMLAHGSRLAGESGRDDLTGPVTVMIGMPLIGLTFAVTAYVIHRRHPHLVAWVMHGIGLALTAMPLGLGLGLTLLLSPTNPSLGSRLVAAWMWFGWAPGLILMTTFLPLLFPTGRPPGRRWWWVAVVGGLGLVFGLGEVTWAAVTRPLPDLILPDAEPYAEGFFFLVLAGAVGAIASMVPRLRRAGVAERQQIKWVASSLGLTSVVIALSVTPFGRSWLAADSVVAQAGGQVVIMGAMCTIPVSIGVAITRYRLFEIDRLLSRTASYGVLTVLLAAVYLGTVVSLQGLLRPVIGQSDLAVAGGTLVVAALFVPTRRRVQAVVDRRFNRSRYDAEQTVAEFTRRLRNEVDLAVLRDDLATVVDETLGPGQVAVWLRVRTGERPS